MVIDDSHTNLNRHTHLILITFILCLMGTTFYFGLRQHPSSFDDAYITYRYARNIAAGHGFVFNQGEFVLGTTTPFYTLLLAALSFIWPDFPVLSHFVGVLAWALCVPVIFGIGSMKGNNLVGLLAAIFMTFNPLLLQVLGMETPLYVLLILATFFAYFKNKMVWAAIGAALVFLMRWDGILVLGVLIFVDLLHRRTLFLRYAGISFAMIAAWLTYSYLTFNSIFPNSFFAKMGQGWNEGLGSVEIGSFARGFWQLAQDAYAMNSLFLLLPVLAVVGLIAVFRDRDEWWPLLLWTLAYIAGYIVLGVLRFSWYYPPTTPAFILLLAKGIVTTTKWIAILLHRPGRTVTLTAVLFLSLVCLIPVIDWLSNSYRPEMGAHSNTYVEVGQWLNQNTPPNSSVAMIEIGIIGFYSDRTVVDTMGLVSPDMIGHLDNWVQTLQFAVNYFWPDYVVALEKTAWSAIVNEAWFQEAYVLETQILNEADPVAPASIYRRLESFPQRSFALSHAPNVSFDEKFVLRTFQLAEAEADAADTLHVNLQWESSRDIEEDYRVHFELLDVANGRLWPLAQNLQPLRGGNPTYQWKQGDTIVDPYTLAIPEDLPDGRYLLKLQVTGKDGIVSAINQDKELVSNVTVGTVSIGNDLPEQEAPSYPLTVTFADNLQLKGFDLSANPQNDELAVTMHWQADADVSKDYTIFVHLLSSDGELIAQHDGQPYLPTTLWSPDFQVIEQRILSLPQDMEEKISQIFIGLYHWPDLERVSVIDAGCLEVKDNAALAGFISFDNSQVPDHAICSDVHWIELE